MNNEPVAYVDPIWMDRPDLVMSHQLEIGKLFARTQFTNYIPLYTHPVKELTDEEIEKLAEIMADMYNQLSLQWKGSRGYSEQCDIMKEILKAILRKAQE